MLLFVIISAIGLWSAQGSPFKQHSLIRNDPNDIYRFCNTTLSYVIIQTLVISPDPPQKNTLMVISAVFTTSRVLTDGEVKLKVVYGSLPIFDKSLDLCGLAEKANITCPIKPGEYNATIKAIIPEDVPSGRYSCNVIAQDQSSEMIGCLQISFSL